MSQNFAISHLDRSHVGEASNVIESLFDHLYSDNEVARNAYRSMYRGADLEERIESSDWIQLIATSGSKVAGVAVSYLDAGMGTLLWLGVEKDFRTHGIGTTLIEKTREEMIARGCHKMDVLARASMPHLRPFYEKRGFRFVALFPKYRYKVDTLYLDQDLPNQITAFV